MHFSTVYTLALPTVVLAAAVPRDSSCNTGPIQCCNSVQPATDSTLESWSGPLGISLTDTTVTGLVGLSCNPISVIGVGGKSCSSQPVCCTSNSFGGLVALGCKPINLNL